MPLRIDIDDQASTALKNLELRLAPKTLRASVGAAVVKLFQNHFKSLGPNENDWPTTNFWARAAAATGFSGTSDGVSINVDQAGVRQRLRGGWIYPTGGRKFLTIPAVAEAYGKRARDFSNLEVVRFSSGYGYSAALVDRTRNREDSTTGILFWLVTAVYQAPNPKVVPTDEQVGTTIFQTLVTCLGGSSRTLAHDEAKS